MRNELDNKNTLESKINDLEIKNNELVQKLSSEIDKNLNLNKIIAQYQTNPYQNYNPIGSQQFENLLDETLYDDKLIVVNFQKTNGGKVYPIICKASSYFIEVMRDFLIKYPEFAVNNGNDLLFMGCGHQMHKMEDMKNNGFGASTILVYKRNN